MKQHCFHLIQACTGQVINVPDASRSASSQYNDQYCQTPMLDATSGGYCAAISTPGTWTQMDLGSVRQITGVVTQGKAVSDQWIASFKVEVSADAASWSGVDGGRIFMGNTDRNTKVTSLFFDPLAAQYVRIYPVTWTGWISYRSAVMLCQAGSIH